MYMPDGLGTLRPVRCLLAWVAALFVLGSLSGCALGYYAQAAHGQFSMLAQARPIDDWLSDAQTSAALKRKLQTVQQIRRYAIEQLGLPDNGSYRNYADLGRPFVVWNVVAAPALSLQAKRWCFPVAGCVAYRGYYKEQSAQEYGAQLRNEGYDVQVQGIPAYSTLGWFDDPVLSTFIAYPDGELARLIFHELSHQLLYVKGDTRFNESFATTVEEAGVTQWLADQHDPAMQTRYEEFQHRRDDFVALLLRYRRRFQTLYDSPADDAIKLQRKAALFDQLRGDYAVLRQSWGGYAGYDRWFAQPLSNAHLASVAAYHDLVPAFRELLRRSGSFPAFYAQVRRLAALDKASRVRELLALAPAELADENDDERAPAAEK